MIRSVDAALTLASLRATVGGAACLSPSLSGRLLGLSDVGDEPRSALLARMFGVRDVALAAAVAESRIMPRRRALQVGLACDLADVLSAAISRRRGLSLRGTVMMGGGAVVFAVLGLIALQHADQ
jgi:hypothetical protein